MTTSRILLVASFFLVLATLALTPIADPDTWWHLKTGEWILENGEIPRTDPYSFTATGKRWVTHEWLFEVIVHFVHSAAGLHGLIVAKALILAAVFGLWSIFLVRRDFPLSAGVWILVAVALLSMGRFTVRPHLFTYLFLSVTLVVLHDYRDFGRNRLAVLPVMFALWANLHSGFIFGLGALGLFLVGETWSTRRFDRRLFFFVVASCLATLFNPNLHDAVLYPIRLSLNPTFKGSVAEHLPIHHPTFRTASFVTWFHVVAALAAALVVVRAVVSRRVDRTAIALCAIFALGTVLANRNRVLFGLSVVPVVAGLFFEARSQRLQALRARFDRPWTSAGSAVLLLVLAAYVGTEGVPLEEHRRRKPALGVSRDTPVRAAEFVRNANLRGPLLNEYRFGGYLIWALSPERPVFIDGRNFVYGEALLEEYRRLVEAAPGFETTLARHAIDYAIFANTVFETGPRGTHPLLKFFATDARWILVHADDAAVIYARRGSSNDAVIDERGYRFVDPFAPGFLREGIDLERDRDAVERELERLIADQPEGIENWIVAANLSASIGNLTRAIEIYEELEVRLPDNADVAGNRGVLLAKAGRHEESRAALERAKRLDPDSERNARWERLARERRPRRPSSPGVAPTASEFEALVRAADSTADAGELPRAIALYERALDLEPRSSRAHFGLGDLHWRAGRVEDCLREYHAALELDSTSVDLLNNLGYVYGSRGDLAKAREYWTRAVALDSTHQAAENLRKLDEIERGGDAR